MDAPRAVVIFVLHMMTPLVRVTLAYMCGLVVPYYLVPDLSDAVQRWWVPNAFCIVVCALVVRVLRGDARTRVSSSASRAWSSVLLLFVLLGVVAGARARTRSNADCRARIPHNAVVRFAAQPASLPGPDGKLTLVLVRAQAPGVTQCAGLVRAKLPPTVSQSLQDGRALVGTGTWMMFESRTRLPTPPERRGMLLIRAVTAAPASVPVSRTLAWRTHSQTVLRATLQESGLAEALVLAQREGVDPVVNERFTATGMSHLLSISGTHVALVAGLLLGFAAFLRVSGNAGRIGATIGVVAYVAFLGAPAAAARSAMQVVLLLSGRMLQRPCDPYSVLAAAALGLVVLQPLNLLDAGFQLSFAGVVGLIAYRRPVADRLPRRMPGWLRDGIAASVAASGVTIPIAAMHFGTVAPIGIPASIIAVPLVGLALPAVSLVLLVGMVSLPLARFFGVGADVLLKLVDGVAVLAMRTPGGHAPLSWGTLMALLATVAAAILTLAWQRDAAAARDRRRIIDPLSAVDRRTRASVARLRIVTAGAAAIAVVAWTPQLSGLYGRGVEIHAIDVGQGDALAIRTPHGRWVLVDAGPLTPRFDAGRSKVVPYLLEHGVRRLDAIVITHPDADHLGGVGSVLAMLGATTIIDPGTASGKPLYLKTMARADSGGMTWFKARDGRRLDIDGVRFDFLYPASDSLDGTRDPNDLSVTFRLRFGRFAALFMGDAPTMTEDYIVAEYGSALESAVLKVGHHGSYTSTSEGLLKAVRPELALISVGRDNRYGHPNPGVMARLMRHRVRVARTDLQGALVVRGRRDGRFSVATQR